jgi:rubrerythrin
MERKQVEELLYQALETEIGGIQIYDAAIGCAENDELREEWEKYGDQTRRHREILLEVFQKLGLNPETKSPGRLIVRSKGQALVRAIETASAQAPGPAAQLVAAECIVDAETKDHMNWELLREVAGKMSGEQKKTIEAAVDEVEDEEDEHLYHTKGWTRELWLESLGLPAVLPPPEEEKDVKTAIGAARAEQQRDQMLKSEKKKKPSAKRRPQPSP